MEQDVNLWDQAAPARGYLEIADAIPHRQKGESTLLECLPATLMRVFDIGSGDGRLFGIVRQARPGIEAVAMEFPEMISVIVESTNNQPLVIERAMYFNMDGVVWTAGTAALATKLQ